MKRRERKVAVSKNGEGEMKGEKRKSGEEGKGSGSENEEG